MNQEPSEEGGDSMAGSDYVEPQCAVSSSPIQLRPSSIEEQTQVATLQVGGPLESGELWFGALSEDEPLGATLALHGGRLSRLDSQGQLIWESEVLGITQIIGVWDFDGNGTQELLVQMTTSLALLSSSTGAEMWNLTDNPLSQTVTQGGVGRVLTSMTEGSTRPELYITDAGCNGQLGEGVSRIYRFSEGGIVEVSEPWTREQRQGIACQRTQILSKDQVDRPATHLVTQWAKGLYRYRLSDGSRSHCGYWRDADVLNDPIKLVEVRVEEHPAWLATIDDKIWCVHGGLSPHLD